MAVIDEQFKTEFRQWLSEMFSEHSALYVSMLGLNTDGKLSYDDHTQTIYAPVEFRESLSRFFNDEGLTVVIIHPLLLQISICS